MNETNSPDKPKAKIGRPLGSMSKLAKDAREAALLTGKLPHEILLEMARGLPVRTMVPSGMLDENGEALFVVKYVALDTDGIRDAAKAAAPYYAPKISTVEVISGVSDDELDRIIAGAAAEAGVGIGVDGEGEESPPPQATRVRKRVGDNPA